MSENAAAQINKLGFKSNGANQTDFVDFGAKDGKSFILGYTLGGKNGLGVDLLDTVVGQAQASGFNVIQGDATNLDLPDKCVRFSTLSHFLEHLPSLDLVKKSILSALRISTDAVYLAGPVYDDEAYLRSLGLKPYWADWRGHTTHLSCKQVVEILTEFGIEKDRYRIRMHAGFSDSNSPLVHPLDSPGNQHDYNPAVHPPKAYVKFDRTCYFEWRCIIGLNNKKWHKNRLLTDLIKPCTDYPEKITWLKSVFY